MRGEGVLSGASPATTVTAKPRRRVPARALSSAAEVEEAEEGAALPSSDEERRLRLRLRPS